MNKFHYIIFSFLFLSMSLNSFGMDRNFVKQVKQIDNTAGQSHVETISLGETKISSSKKRKDRRKKRQAALGAKRQAALDASGEGLSRNQGRALIRKNKTAKISHSEPTSPNKSPESSDSDEKISKSAPNSPKSDKSSESNSDSDENISLRPNGQMINNNIRLELEVDDEPDEEEKTQEKENSLQPKQLLQGLVDCEVVASLPQSTVEPIDNIERDKSAEEIPGHVFEAANSDSEDSEGYETPKGDEPKEMGDGEEDEELDRSQSTDTVEIKGNDGTGDDLSDEEDPFGEEHSPEESRREQFNKLEPIIKRTCSAERLDIEAERKDVIASTKREGQLIDQKNEQIDRNSLTTEFISDKLKFDEQIKQRFTNKASSKSEDKEKEVETAQGKEEPVIAEINSQVQSIEYDITDELDNSSFAGRIKENELRIIELSTKTKEGDQAVCCHIVDGNEQYQVEYADLNEALNEYLGNKTKEKEDSEKVKDSSSDENKTSQDSTLNNREKQKDTSSVVDAEGDNEERTPEDEPLETQANGVLNGVGFSGQEEKISEDEIQKKMKQETFNFLEEKADNEQAKEKQEEKSVNGEKEADKPSANQDSNKQDNPDKINNEATNEDNDGHDESGDQDQIQEIEHDLNRAAIEGFLRAKYANIEQISDNSYDVSIKGKKVFTVDGSYEDAVEVLKNKLAEDASTKDVAKALMWKMTAKSEDNALSDEEITLNLDTLFNEDDEFEKPRSKILPAILALTGIGVIGTLVYKWVKDNFSLNRTQKHSNANENMDDEKKDEA